MTQFSQFAIVASTIFFATPEVTSAGAERIIPAAVESFVYCSAAKDQSIDLLRLNSDSGSLTKVARFATQGEPGALTTSPDGRFLFVAMRSTGRLASFRIDPESGRLTTINEVAAGDDPAQISVDHSGRFLLTAYYVAGKVSVHGIAADGSLGEQPVQEIATADKAHCIVPDATNRFVFAAHTGSNAIFQFRWNAQEGRLSPLPQLRFNRPEMSGPRHIAWHPTHPIAYINNEQSSSVTAYRVNDDGTLQSGNSVSTLPADFEGNNSTAEIKVHPNGKFLYVSNRGHDSLAVIRLSDSGEDLTFVAAEPTQKTPRSFDIEPQGKFLIAAGEASGRLSVCRIDPNTGRLSQVQTEEIGPMLWWVQIVAKRTGTD